MKPYMREHVFAAMYMIGLFVAVQTRVITPTTTDEKRNDSITGVL